MFDSLSDKLGSVLRNLRKKGTLSEKDIDVFLREVKLVFLEADIHFKVVRDFLARVREKALREEVLRLISPGDQVSKIVHDELLSMLGTEEGGRKKRSKSGLFPYVLLMAGLQGAGKTTACVKLARFLREREDAKGGIIAADLSRPAAIDQLSILAQKHGVEVFADKTAKDPVELVRRGREYFSRKDISLVIVDTAGRIHLDTELMAEIKRIHKAVEADEVCLVLDAMTGQEALHITEEFNKNIPLDGAIISKMDGDARGGGAVSFRAVTGKPIFFFSHGERVEDFEEFFPERIVSRIMGMGDMMSMVERAQSAISERDAREIEEQMQAGGMNMNAVLTQIRTIRKMGGISSILGMLPGAGKLRGAMDEASAADPMKKTEAVILSMTAAERARPELIDGQRRVRIAAGSGTKVSDVNDVLKQYNMMKKMMKGSNQKKLMKQMKQLNRTGGMKWHQ